YCDTSSTPAFTHSLHDALPICICYAKLDDSVITDDIKDDAIKTKGYFIYPSQLFCNVAAEANTNDRLNADLNSIFVAIESSAYRSEEHTSELQSRFDLVCRLLL